MAQGTDEVAEVPLGAEREGFRAPRGRNCDVASARDSTVTFLRLIRTDG